MSHVMSQHQAHVVRAHTHTPMSSVFFAGGQVCFGTSYLHRSFRISPEAGDFTAAEFIFRTDMAATLLPASVCVLTGQFFSLPEARRPRKSH